MTTESEFTKFDKTIRRLLAVPHAAIKARIEAEKMAKKRKKSKKSSASREADDRA